MHPKERIYDEQISPLVLQIIAICKEHKIANVMSFAISDSYDDGCCTTFMTAEEFDAPRSIKDAARSLLIPKPSPLMMTITKTD